MKAAGFSLRKGELGFSDWQENSFMETVEADPAVSQDSLGFSMGLWSVVGCLSSLGTRSPVPEVADQEGRIREVMTFADKQTLASQDFYGMLNLGFLFI